MSLKKEVQNLLKQYEIKPLKRFGQNFLIDKTVIAKIITAADIKSSDEVLEIGPGFGFLTRELAKNAKMVVAIEKDRKMNEILREELKNYNNVEIIQEDILKSSVYQTDRGPISVSYKVVANLPYYITSPVIRKFLEAEKKPKEMTLMVQKEVGQRICAKPPHMSILSVSVQFYSQPKIISYVSRKAFWPMPKVDSAIIKITPFGHVLESHDREIPEHNHEVNEKLFFEIVKAGFSHPRKQLKNNLSNFVLDSVKHKGGAEGWLIGNGIEPNRRAETLSVKDWINLTKSYTS